MKHLFVAFALALVAAPVGLARAAGSIEGTVRVEGMPARPRPSPIGKDASVCGKEAASEALLVGPDRALANVVVSIRGLKALPPPPTPNAAVDQVGCRYTPHVQAVTVGTRINLLNNDAVLHNVHGTLNPKSPVTVFNVAMPFKGQKLPTLLKRPGMIKLRCDAGHTWMSAYVAVFEHPYFAVTDAKGKFTIKDVPPGKHTLELWHEPLDDKAAPWTRTVEVEVAEGKTAAVDAALAP